MTTSTTTANFFSRIRAALHKRRATSKRVWARVEEPDQIIRPVFFGVFTVLLTALVSMVIYNLMTVPGGVINWIAMILAETANGSTYEQVYAAFGIAVITLVNLTAFSVYAFLSHSDEDDVIEMISDLDANLMERLAEIEHNLNTSLEDIKRNA